MPLHYAVLAQVSLGYSPPEGRLPTCYSPGRHSTNPRRGFRVRLACVRHAASVDSEPGSNSQLKPWPSLSLSRKMTVLLLATSAKLSERLVRFTHYLVFKDRLIAFASCEQTLIIPNKRTMSTTIQTFLLIVVNRPTREKDSTVLKISTPRRSPTIRVY